MDQEITEELAWTRVDDVIQQFLDGKSLTEIRGYTTEKYPGIEIDKSNFCGDRTVLDCVDCPLNERYKKEVSYCVMTFLCPAIFKGYLEP